MAFGYSVSNNWNLSISSRSKSICRISKRFEIKKSYWTKYRNNWGSNESNIKCQSEYRNTSARKIVDTRNRISHGYDSVSDDIIWAIVIRDIPILKQEVEKLIAN